MAKKRTVQLNEKYLQRNWLRLRDGGSFHGVDTFIKSKGLGELRRVQSALSKLRTYSLHKPHKSKFRRRSFIVKNYDLIWACDLVQLTQFARENKGYHYILTVMETFSRFVWNFPVYRKNASLVSKQFANLFKLTKRSPRFLWSDRVS